MKFIGTNTIEKSDQIWFNSTQAKLTNVTLDDLLLQAYSKTEKILAALVDASHNAIQTPQKVTYQTRELLTILEPTFSLLFDSNTKT